MRPRGARPFRTPGPDAGTSDLLVKVKKKKARRRKHITDAAATAAAPYLGPVTAQPVYVCADTYGRARGLITLPRGSGCEPAGQRLTARQCIDEASTAGGARTTTG